MSAPQHDIFVCILMLLDLYFGNSLCRWKVLDFAELKRSSISFFDIEKPETAVSRWARARTRAAKVSAILKLCELYFFDRYCSMMVLNLFVAHLL